MLKKHRTKINALMCFAIAIILAQMTPNKTTCNVAKAVKWFCVLLAYIIFSTSDAY